MYRVGIVFVALSVMALVVGVSGGLFVGVANAAAPGDLLYSVDRSMEDLRMELFSSPAAERAYKEQLIQERFEEIQKLTENGDSEYLDSALNELNQVLENLDADLASDVSADDLDK